MHPEKERPSTARREPLRCPRRHLVAPTLDRVITVFTWKSQPESGVVGVEPTFESGSCSIARVENQRPHEGGGPVTLLSEQIGQIGRRSGKRRPEIIDPVEWRICTCQDGCVRYGRNRRLRK